MRMKEILGSKCMAAILIFLFILLPEILLGDGMSIGKSGNTPVAMKNDNIKLLSELLKMKAIPYNSYRSVYYSAYKIESDCWYLLENITDTLQSFTIGFYQGKDWLKPRPGEFYATVDAEEVEHRFEVVKYEGSRPEESHFAVWDMVFQPLEKKMVYVNQKLRFYEGHGEGDLALILSGFTYELSMAKSWAQKPERIDVYFDFDTVFNKDDSCWSTWGQYKIKPDNYTWLNNHTLFWQFNNTDDIENIELDIEFYETEVSKEYFLNNWINSVAAGGGLQSTWYKGNKELYSEANMLYGFESDLIEELREIPTRYEAYKILLELHPAYLRNYIYAVHGYPFKNEMWRSLFEKCQWYNAREDFSESDFNEFEKNNIQFILEYEKKVKEYLEELEKEEAGTEAKPEE